MPDGIYYVTSGNSDLSLLDLIHVAVSRLQDHIHPVVVSRLPLTVAGSTEVYSYIYRSIYIAVRPVVWV